MNARRNNRYRKRLESLRNRLRTDAAAAAQEALGPSGGQAGGELSNAPMHLGDGGSEEFLHDMSAALAENAAYLHAEVGAAVERFDFGRFGLCEKCGDVLTKERLDAMPYARYCVKCAEANHWGLDVNLDFGRPHTPADTLAPEGSMQEDWRAEDDPITGAEGRHTVAVDEHAAGEPGGGGATGGLAGSNSGDGEPEVADLQDEAGSGNFDHKQSRDNPPNAPRSGRSGGAVGGTPANKRAK